MKLAKARLEDDAGGSVEFQFNPDSITFNQKAEWVTTPTPASDAGPTKEFKGAGPVKLGFDLVLDDSEDAGSRVTDDVNLLASWTYPTERSQKTTPAPHELVFSWGQFKIGQAGKFSCHLASVGVNYTMFRPNGVPVRAKVKVELESTMKTKWRQNPTSGGTRPQRRHVLQRGDRLGVIASREYGNAGYWRQIADFNGLDDPFNLPVGRQILLPAAEELMGI